MTIYRKSMSEAYASMYEATMSSSQIARLKKAYEPMRDKKISTSNANKLSAMMDKVGKDKEALLQLFRADIPFVSQSAVTKLITKHNMKGAEINKLRDIKSHKDNPHPQDEEVDLDEDASNFKSAVARIKKAKSAKDLKKLEKSFERVYKQTGALTDKEFGQLDDMISDKLVKLGEEVDLDKLPDMRDALRQVRAEEVDLDEAVDKIAADELKMYIENDAQLYKSQLIPIVKNMQRKMKSGKYDHRKAPKLWMYLVDAGAKKYVKEFGGDVRNMFDKQTRQSVAQQMADEYKDEIEAQGGTMFEEVDLDEGKMSQLHQYIKDKKSPEEIAKLMKLDVKTIKSLMSEIEPDDEEEEIKEGKPGLWNNIHKKRKSGRPMRKPGEKGAPTDQDFKDSQEGAAADARRAMSKDKDLRRGKDSADDDDSATDDDVKAASKNIMMQLRKSISLKGRFDVEFGDKKKTKIPAAMAQAVTQKYNSLKKPVDKEKFQAKISKSYKDMLKTMKEGFEPSETILERMNRKLRENKNG